MPLPPRRRTVSGEVLGKVEEVEAIPKEDAEEQWLREQLAAHYLFSHLEGLPAPCPAQRCPTPP